MASKLATKKTKRIRTNKICFTVNNFTLKENKALHEYLNAEQGIAYAIVGCEIGEKGTRHLQGYIRLRSSCLKARDGIIGYWKGRPGLGRAHLEPAIGSDENNRGKLARQSAL